MNRVPGPAPSPRHGTALTPRDATMYWLSARTPNDLFLLYAFADTGRSTAELRAALANRVADIPDLLVRVLDTPANIAYPIWATCEFIDEQFAEHELPVADWSHLTAALGTLLATGLDAAHRPWRLHVFRDIQGAPTFAPEEPALIAVLQISHALADGRRAAALARALFTPSPSQPVTAENSRSLPNLLDRIGPTGWPHTARAITEFPIAMARTIIRGFSAYRAEQRLAELTAAGVIPPPPTGASPNLLNGNGSAPETHTARMIVRPAQELRIPGHTVTVVAATAISLALQRYLATHGDPAETLLAQIPMSVAADSGPRNSYRDLSTDLSIREPNLVRRATLIAADLAARRQRALHPLQEARSGATEALPAPILHRDVSTYPIDVLPERVSGHTVISSVHRGPTDLTFADGRSHFTAGFPATGSVMRLTHGLHTLGPNLTLSLHADPAAIPDLETYADLLDAALTEVIEALAE
ncbi:wax ester/triacylglycerol synthase family O-acyltransferase [Nocardia sp. NBC_01503]|uniref:wax ester/triacylglycerol synthase domain-containing protein n=1 Tax=Nocardia sp. NBC_01503 TaxID=2975997 RepID=UPI002E7BA0C9|nr:wax ester/triacylglycerol synthase domain-containing protein [Nocardia sp. NBC_01503]WTL34539.1 wax ester/triacylglycerol synthase family O-acyltransferase [Nocardia sp. NBC_01503]